MTAHCRPAFVPESSDIEKAGEFVAIAIDPAVPYTAAIKKIAYQLAEMRAKELEEQ